MSASTLRLALLPSATPITQSTAKFRTSGFGLGLGLTRQADPLRVSLPVPARALTATPQWKRRGDAGVCHALAPVSARTLHWVSAVSTAILMLVKGTAIRKSFLVPFFALQAPSCIISWIKGDYGQWTAFLALLIRLFYFIPGELELPLSTMLLVSVAPYQLMNLRGTQGGAIISLAIAGYLAFQHFSRVGSLEKAFDQGSIIATLAIICITVIPCLLLF